MMLVALGALRSSPGVTTATLAIASCLDGAVIVEGDWDGGVLATRFGLTHEPGLATLAAAARTSSEVDLATHAQSVAGGTLVVPGPTSADSAAGIWTSAGDRLTSTLRSASRQRPVLVDVGRLSPLAPLAPLLSAADRVVVVARPLVEELHAITANLDRVRSSASGRVAVLLVGNRPYPAAEVAAQLQVEVVGFLADDRRTADAITGRGAAMNPRALRRSALARSARDVAERLVEPSAIRPHAGQEVTTR